MLLGIGVFLFVVCVGKLTTWRVHSQVCDNHLIILPMPNEEHAESAVFRHAADLFNVDALLSILFFWRKPSDSAAEEASKKPGPVPVKRLSKALLLLREWAAKVAATFRIVCFGRRIVVTSAPRLARRVLHTHFKMYSKDPKNDPNSQLPVSLHWFMPNCERGLLTRPDMKDRSTHGASRVAFAQALLRAAYDAPGLRSTVRGELKGIGEGAAGGEVDLPAIQRATVRIVLRLLVSQHIVGEVFAGGVESPKLVNFLRDVSTAADELARQESEPWRSYMLRLWPAWRQTRSRMITVAREIATKCFYYGAESEKSPFETTPPLVTFAKTECPPLSSMDASAASRVKKALIESITCEVLVALLKAVGPMSLSVAWGLHYCALPQNHSVVNAIRAEADERPPLPEADLAPAPEQPGAVEVLREVLRLHPPVPLITRTALNDDLVAVPDIDVPNGKLNHAMASQMDGNNRGSLAQRSGCVLLPSSSVIAINMDVLLKRTDIFGSDAAEFKPRRFLGNRAGMRSVADGVAHGGNQKADMSTWFLAGGFGIGARGCPAAHWVLPVAAEMLRALLMDTAVEHPAGKQRDPARWHLRLKGKPRASS